MANSDSNNTPKTLAGLKADSGSDDTKKKEEAKKSASHHLADNSPRGQDTRALPSGGGDWLAEHQRQRDANRLAMPAGVERGEFSATATAADLSVAEMAEGDVIAYGNSKNLTAGGKAELEYNRQLSLRHKANQQPAADDNDSDQGDKLGSKLNLAETLAAKKPALQHHHLRHLAGIGLLARFLHKFRKKKKQLEEKAKAQRKAAEEKEKKLTGEKKAEEEPHKLRGEERELRAGEKTAGLAEDGKAGLSGERLVGEAGKTADAVRVTTKAAASAAKTGEVAARLEKAGVAVARAEEMGSSMFRGLRMARNGAAVVGVGAAGAAGITIAAAGGALLSVVAGVAITAVAATAVVAGGTYFGVKYLTQRANASAEKSSELAGTLATKTIIPTFKSWTIGMATDLWHGAKALYNDPKGTIQSAWADLKEEGHDAKLAVVAMADSNVRNATLDAAGATLAGNKDAVDKTAIAMKKAAENKAVLEAAKGSSFDGLVGSDATQVPSASTAAPASPAAAKPREPQPNRSLASLKADPDIVVDTTKKAVASTPTRNPYLTASAAPSASDG